MAMTRTTGKKTDEVKRPSLAYYLAHVKDEHLLLVENVDPEASPTDRAAVLGWDNESFAKQPFVVLW